MKTCIDVTRTPRPDVYDKVTRVLHKRFGKRLIKINHAGKTVKLKEWDEEW